MGTTPIGATLVGYLTQDVDARAPFVLAGIGTFLCGLVQLRSDKHAGATNQSGESTEQRADKVGTPA